MCSYTIPFYDFCSFWCVAVNTMDKLQFLSFIRVNSNVYMKLGLLIWVSGTGSKLRGTLVCCQYELCRISRRVFSRHARLKLQWCEFYNKIHSISNQWSLSQNLVPADANVHAGPVDHRRCIQRSTPVAIVMLSRGFKCNYCIQLAAIIVQFLQGDKITAQFDFMLGRQHVGKPAITLACCMQ